MSQFIDFLKSEYLEEISEEFGQTDTHVIHHYHSSPSIKVVKEKTGVSFGKLYRILQNHGVKPYRRQKASRYLVPVYHQQGMNIEQIASLTNYTPRNIRNILKEKSAN